jgi:hypothetical protein
MKKKLEIVSITLIFLGLAVSFVEMNGWFPNPRLELANRIMNLRENIMPFDTPHADELVISFLRAKNPKLNKNNFNNTLRDYKGIAIEDITMDGHDTFGSVRIQHKDGIRVGVICGFQDLKNWAEAGSQYVKWIGWDLTLSGAFVSIGILFIKGS